MMLTLEELKEKIAENYDEVLILELLNVNSYDLVEAFSERIEKKFDTLITEFEEEAED